MRKDISMSSFNTLKTSARLWMFGGGDIELFISQENPEDPTETESVSLNKEQIKQLFAEVFDALIEQGDEP